MARWLAVGASIALHAALAAALYVFAREPLKRAFLPAGSVEVGVVFSEPKRPAEPGAPAPSAGAVLSAPRRARPAPPAAPEPAPNASTPAAGSASAVGSPPAAPAPVAASGAESDVAVRAGGEQGGAGDAAAAASGTGAGTGPGAADGAGAGAVAQGAGAGAGGGGGGTGQADVDRELRSRLAASAARCYPRAAQRFRAEGTTRVRFCVAADGRPRDEEIVETSGQSLLDDAALRCVIAKAAPFPRTAACFTVPIHFFVP